ncbi:uncharacterized protein METZ01_LOCUS61948 [marine metagenome]|uniref:Uncharacterized protein n=1 Tax=marine metagenome TaxID=408172 RepID=A0A381T090_9ZZZZ
MFEPALCYRHVVRARPETATIVKVMIRVWRPGRVPIYSSLTGAKRKM